MTQPRFLLHGLFLKLKGSAATGRNFRRRELPYAALWIILFARVHRFYEGGKTPGRRACGFRVAKLSGVW